MRTGNHPPVMKVDGKFTRPGKYFTCVNILMQFEGTSQEI
jgi:hypothetical protein